MNLHPLRRRARARLSPGSFVALLLAASLAVTGCSEESPAATPAEDESPTAQSTAEGSSLSGQWPLTGLPASGEAPEHPVIVVKIDNTYASSPQVGLGEADLVVEELVEGGSTRLAVFYYSALPDRVGPVRSMRATDIGIVEPVDGVLVSSGGAGPTVRRMASAQIRTVTEGGPGFSRDSGRAAPYNLFVDLPQLARTLEPRTPQDYLPWGSGEDLPPGRKATGLEAQFSGGHTTEWEFRGGKYVNTGSHAAAGDEYRPDTVLVLRVKVGDAGYLDPAGNPVPESRLTGRGEALVFHGGEVVRATWVKPGLDAPIDLRTKEGELRLPPGKVWIELVPAQDGDVRVIR